MKLLIKLIVGLICFLACSIGLLYGLLILENAQAKKFLAASEHLPLATHQKILEQTIDFEYQGRGFYIPAAQAYITNYHIIEKACYSDCTKVDFKKKLAREPEYEQYLTTFNVVQCIEWLDICLLEDKSQPMIKEKIDFTEHEVKTQENIFVLPLSQDVPSDGKILKGSFFEKKWFTQKALLAVRRGYSGSPVFTTEGAFAGIVTFESSRYVISPKKILRATGFTVNDKYLSHSGIISAQVIKEFLYCEFFNKEETCHAKELERIYDAIRASIDYDEVDFVNGSILKIQAKTFLDEYRTNDQISKSEKFRFIEKAVANPFVKSSHE